MCNDDRLLAVVQLQGIQLGKVAAETVQMHGIG